jgi:hypothetical protein
MVTETLAGSSKTPSGSVYQRRATAPLATGLSARPSGSAPDGEPVGSAALLPLGVGEAVDVPGAHADSAIATAAMRLVERTTTSSYEEGMRNL